MVIDHGGGVLTWYWHLRAQVVVFPGQGVSIGDTIGYEGTTGMSTGCHLHFAVNDHGVWTNPRWYLPDLNSGPGPDPSPSQPVRAWTSLTPATGR